MNAAQRGLFKLNGINHYYHVYELFFINFFYWHHFVLHDLVFLL